jgi:CubicO group peptidase (beta-lactamase class C family)
MIEFAIRFSGWSATVCLLAGMAGAAAKPVNLNGDLAAVRKEFGLPSLAAVVFSADKLLAQGADGKRRAGADAVVTIEDKYHIGSITKSITATLAAIMVEEGRLEWETTLSETLPGVSLHREVRGVTLDQLLRHRSGIERDIPNGLFEELRLSDVHPTTQRDRLAREMLKRAPTRPPGSAFEYSNAGYSFAGLMIERRASQAWENLVKEKVFKPLRLMSAGFGAPAKNPQALDQPWGHTAGGQPITPGPQADNVPAIGPAGTVHMTLGDLARYGQWHLREEGPLDPPLIKPQTLRRLHGTGEPDGYQLGWQRVTRSWAGSQAIYHNGSNTMFYAVLWLAPQRDFGVAVAANQGGSEAEEACDAVAGKMVARFCQP